MTNFPFNIIFTLLLLVGCNNNSSLKESTSALDTYPEKSKDVHTGNNQVADDHYDLKKPERSWVLPSELLEVSGNAWVDYNHFLLIDDRYSNLYSVRITDNDLVLEQTIPFLRNKKGNYDLEDVAMINDVVYILSSHGILFKITNWNSNPSVKEIHTPLSKANNPEGLCYDPVTKNLLIACKFASGIKGEDKSTKAIYEFNILKEKIEKEPFLTIHKEDFEKLAGKKLLFYPSAIAVHPLTRNIYLLSTRENKCMAVYNREGVLISFQFIDEYLMPQPERICFSPEGKLYITSEGKKGQGKFLEFKME